jgi:PPOX class probable F420-dependent enzyme
MTTTLDPTTEAGAEAVRRLTDDRIGWLTTVDERGRPMSSPVWFLWRDGEILVHSHRAARRNRHIEARQDVGFHLETDASGDRYVTMEGIARIDPDGPRAAEDAEYLAKYAERIADYGWTVDWFDAEYPIVLRITPTRWRTA